MWIGRRQERIIIQTTKHMSDSPLQHTASHVLEPVYVPQALNTVTCTNHIWRWAISYFIPRVNTRNLVSQNYVIWKLGRGFGKKWRWMDREGGNKTRKKLLAAGEAWRLYFDRLEALRGEHPSAMGSQQRGQYLFCVRGSTLQVLQ